MWNRLKSKTYRLHMAGILVTFIIANSDLVSGYLGEHAILILAGFNFAGMMIREMKATDLKAK